MKNLKMKKIIVALTLVMAMSGATLALASCGKDETSGTTAAETTAKVTEEETTTTEEAVTFSDADISSKAAEYEENGMTIEAIDASYIECDASVFVEGFKATDANGDEYVCVKFTDDEAGNAFINDVLCEKASGYGVSTFNGKTWFNMTDWIEGTLENGLMEYGPEKEDDDVDVDPEIVWDEEVYEFKDPEVAAFYEEYSSKGWFITPMDSTLGALEGFNALGAEFPARSLQVLMTLTPILNSRPKKPVLSNIPIMLTAPSHSRSHITALPLRAQSIHQASSLSVPNIDLT